MGIVTALGPISRALPFQCSSPNNNRNNENDKKKLHLAHFLFPIMHVVTIGCPSCLCRQFASVSAFVSFLSPNLDMSTSTSHVTTTITTTMTRSKIVTESVPIGFYLVHKRERHRVNRQLGIPHTCQFWGTTTIQACKRGTK